MTIKSQDFIFRSTRRSIFLLILATLLSVIPISFTVPGQQINPSQTKTILPDGRSLILRAPGFNSEIFDPKTGKTTVLTSATHQPRIGHTATVLPDGTVFIFGGVESNGSIPAAAELFNPDTLTFEQLSGNPLTPRAYHTATLLSDGKVLITGGIGNNDEALPTAELFNWQTRTAEIATGNLAFARSRHKAVLQADGSVVLLGGKGGLGKKLKNAERYDPPSQQFAQWNLPFIEPGPSELAESIPSDGATNVALDTIITFRFTRPLSVESVNERNVSIQSFQGRVSSRIIAAESGMLVFCSPREELSSSTTYALTLKGLQDSGGIPLPRMSISFSTVGDTVPEIHSESEDDSEDWTPEASGYFEKWRTGRSKSPWQLLQALKAPDGVTAVTGQALKLNGFPLKNATIRIGDVWAQTDETGRFLASPVTPGVREMIIDGRTANTQERKYGIFITRIDVNEGETNVLPFTIWMTRLDMKHAIHLPSPTTTEIVVTTPKIPGLEIHIPAGTVIRDIDGNLVTKFSITPIPMDRGPIPGPIGGVQFPYLFTMQPGGSTVEGPGIWAIHPNYGHLPPGTKIPLWRPDRQIGWIIYGKGTVSADGQQVVSDPDAVVHMLSCGALGDPSTAPVDECKEAREMAADPVACGTGLFMLSNTDLYLPDVIPIDLTRVYRTNDWYERPFGYGASHAYEMFLVGDIVAYTYADLIQADGSRIHYDRISPGSDFSDAVMESTTTAGEFYKSVLSWNGSIGSGIGGWDLKLRNGTIYQFIVAIFKQKVMLSAIIDRNGNKLTIERDLFNTNSSARYRILSITSPNGKWIQFSYVDAGSHRISQITDNIGRTVSYTYTGVNLWTVTDANNGVTEYAYQGNQMTSVKDPRGNLSVVNEYNAANRVFKQTRADLTTYQYAYTLDGNGKVIQTDVTNPRGYVRRILFNSDGFSTSDTSALGAPEEQTTTYQRETGTNNLLSMTDPLGRITNFTYDSMGNSASVTEVFGTPEARTSMMTYEPVFNQVSSITDSLNHITTFDYDLKGNLIKVTNPLGNSITFSYNAQGQRTSVTDPLGNTTQFAYQSANLVSETNPLGYTVTQFTDAAGRPVSRTSPSGQIVRNEYDPLNRLIRTIDPLLGSTNFSYDGNSNLFNVTDARNNPTGFGFNNMNRRETRTDPLTRVQSYLYDNNGNLRQVTDRKNQITIYTYDPLDRLTQVQYNDGSTIAFTYDDGNRLTQVVDSLTGTITLGYDNFDQLTSQTTSLGTVSYTYDDAGRRETMTVAGLPTVNYSYDDANHLTQITQGSATVTMGYDAAGRRTSEALPNGVVTDYLYDKASQLTAITYRQGSNVIGELTYEYDVDGRLIKVGGSFARTGLPSALTSATYNAANHQLTFGVQSLTYDNNGNLISDGINTLTWNARDQLIGISGPGLTATFEYDGLGRRKSKTLNGTSTAFLYDGFNPVQELVGVTPNANFLTGLNTDQYFSRTDASGPRYFLTDRLNSTVALTDSSTAVQTEYKYDPFGRVTIIGPASSNSYQYTSRENDANGLMYYRNRFYSPTLQRFLSEDPIEFLGGDTNLYSYVFNSPTNLIDPTGLDRYEITVGDYTLQIDANQGPHGNIHIKDRKGKEIAVINAWSKFLEKHKGKDLPIQRWQKLDKAVQRALAELLPQLRKIAIAKQALRGTSSCYTGLLFGLIDDFELLLRAIEADRSFSEQSDYEHRNDFFIFTPWGTLIENPSYGTYHKMY